jgi:hypothetical protein
MQNTTPDNIVQLPNVAPSMYDPAILAHPEFVSGFQAGIESFEEISEDEGRPMTAIEVQAEIWHNIDPQRRAFDAEVVARLGFPSHPLFDAGFMAGVLYAHWLTPAPAHVPPMKRRFGHIIPVRMQ